jgi:dTDP-4-dehydrorhamnose 3,5-epimerase
MINDVYITPLKIIDTPGGNVMHAMKENDKGFYNFGEAYFSEIEEGAIKAWKRHRDMTLNIIVPFGKIRFILFDDRSKFDKQFQEIILSKNNYSRITIPPMIWVGFQGLFSERSLLLNIANIMHNPKEVDKKNIEEIKFNWKEINI